MNKLLALADRVEKLTGPDREVDCLIWCHVKGIEPKWVGRLLDAGEEGIIGWIDPGKTQRNFNTNRQESGPGSIPPYTASLDAAMTLVPENAITSLANEQRWKKPAWSWGINDRHGVTHFGSAATPALALVAAALRARAHGGGEG